MLLSALVAPGALVELSAATQASSFGYVDDAGAKSYSQVQRAWEESANKSQREQYLAMRGVAKVTDPSTETDRSRKRRAMAGCKDDLFRNQAGYKAESDCNARVMSGDLQFILDVMNAE